MNSLKKSSILIILNLIQLIILTTANNNYNHRLLHRVKRIVGGKPAAIPPPDDPVVFIRLHERFSRIEGIRNKKTGIYSFYGIRYADPPIGSNRFARPRFRRPTGEINATQYGPPCPQPDPNNPQIVYGEEDCLLLNIFTPQMPDETTGLPVYVWIHPGGFRYGSAAQYDAQPIAQKNIIFVPVQYRLGTLGILGEGTKEFSGNLAMMDMTVALRWVTEYISYFGGDRKQIKVIGHGSGAASAMYLSMSKMPKSGGTDITGVVSMSGSALSQYATDTEPVQSVQEIAAINECSPENPLEMINCMRTKSFEDIIKRDNEIQTERLQGRSLIKGISGNVGYNPHVEEPDDYRGLPGFLTGQPNEIVENGSFTRVPLLIGVTKHETGNGMTVNTITKIWGSAEKFLKSLIGVVNTFKNFLKIDERTGELLKPVLPGLNSLGIDINQFLKVPKELNPEEVLSKLTEATTDVLFNLPAVLSADLWGRVAPSFLYSFEYSGGEQSNGYNFLQGLPIVSSKKNPNFTSHGDELGFLFDVNDIFGKPIENAKLKSENDIKVRNNFITFLSKFAKIDSKQKVFGGGDSIFSTFKNKGTPFIQITDKLELKDNFRFCELSLWGAPIEAIQSTTCQGLTSSLNQIKNVIGGTSGKLTDTIKNVGRGNIFSNNAAKNDVSSGIGNIFGTTGPQENLKKSIGSGTSIFGNGNSGGADVILGGGNTGFGFG